MSENTPQLDLLMKDPTLDGHEYFNVKTMMNDNWEKIDKFAGEAKASIENLEDRLNTKAEEEVVLNGGVQIVNAARSAPFSLKELKGRTLVNLAGRDGNCENISRFSPWQATLSADTTNKSQGSQSLKVTVKEITEGTSGTASTGGFPIKAGSYYIIVAEVKLGSGTSVGAYIGGLTSSKSSGNIADTTNFKPTWKAYNAVASALTGYAIGEVIGSVGSFGYIDAIRVYEISTSEYAMLDNMTADQIAAKYPYVDSVTPVRNPYAIRYGENLLPPFNEWAQSNGAAVTAPYSLTYPYTAGLAMYNTVDLPTVPEQTYTLKVNNSVANARNVINFYDASGTKIDGAIVSGISIPPSAGDNIITYRAPAGAKTMRVYLYGDPSASGMVTFTNPMLNIGSEALPFVPREDAMLALQTDLFADPVTGANADSIFEQGGQYFKAKRWIRVVLDDSLTYAPGANPATGIRRVITILPTAADITVENLYVGTKYDGKIQPIDVNADAADEVYINSNGVTLTYSLSNTDTGWGDNFTPSSDEIKAFFLGWKMYQGGQGNVNIPYNNAGSKAWVPLDAISIVNGTPSGSTYTTTLPTQPITSMTYTRHSTWTPYELVYQLATPSVEPIVSEGQLTFNEGSNQVEVGTGIVLRESSKAYVSNTDGSAYFNSILNPFRHKTRKVLRLFINSKQEKRAVISTGDAYGLERFRLYAFDYAPSASYTATYLMLETSPVQSIIGDYTVNEKSLLDKLVENLAKQEIRLSTVENKKAEKDRTTWTWITPTLLNGSAAYMTDLSYGVPRYKKTSDGMVHFIGLVTVTALNAVMFVLPVGYRPASAMKFIVPGVGAYAVITIGLNGNVYVSGGNVGTSNWISLANITFEAEA